MWKRTKSFVGTIIESMPTAGRVDRYYTARESSRWFCSLRYVPDKQRLHLVYEGSPAAVPRATSTIKVFANGKTVKFRVERRAETGLMSVSYIYNVSVDVSSLGEIADIRDIRIEAP